ncbi:MAG: hypothetical protein KAS72_12230 [Phycisphaerales bacterium]|nr:hypothetical protein [Phycisphaerales bacterium]
MRSRVYITSVAACAVLAASTTAVAGEYDPTGLAGQCFDAEDSVVDQGVGDPMVIRRWIPFILPDSPDAMNLIGSAVTRVVLGDLLGGLSTAGYEGFEDSIPNMVAYFATADQVTPDGDTYVSNNVVLDEQPELWGDVVGQMLPDGTLALRAVYGEGMVVPNRQNNLQWVLSDVMSQLPPPPEPTDGFPILTGPGIDNDGLDTVYLGTPAALEDDPAVEPMRFWIGNTNSADAMMMIVPIGTNIWDYRGMVLPAAMPDYTYHEAFGDEVLRENGYFCLEGDARHTQPVLNRVNDLNYVLFGIGEITTGGSARPRMLVVDAYEDGDGFLNRIDIPAPWGHCFIDHTAYASPMGIDPTVLENKHFDMNTQGQIAALAVAETDPEIYKVLLYDPLFDFDGRIIGYVGPMVIAEANPVGGIPGDLVGLISGVGINDFGNIAFTAEYYAPDEPGRAISTAAYFYHAADDTLHQVLRTGDLIENQSPDGGAPIIVGPIPVAGIDAFFATNLADNANVMAVTFTPAVDQPGDLLRGATVMLAVNHQGDTDFDCDVDQSDLGELLAAYDSVFMDGRYDPEVDFNGDGAIDQSDLGILLSRYGTSCS